LAKLTPTDMRNQVLKERGIVSVKPAKNKQRRLKPVPRPPTDPRLKTPMMRYLELVYGESIEDLLLSGSLSVVAKKVDNEVDVSTISKWIKRLKLRYTADNLPNCEGCRSYAPACDGGVCMVLMELQLYGLVPLKREEILG